MIAACTFELGDERGAPRRPATTLPPQPDTLLHPRSFFEKHKTRFAVFSRSSTFSRRKRRSTEGTSSGRPFGPGAGPVAAVVTAASSFARGHPRTQLHSHAAFVKTRFAVFSRSPGVHEVRFSVFRAATAIDRGHEFRALVRGSAPGRAQLSWPPRAREGGLPPSDARPRGMVRGVSSALILGDPEIFAFAAGD